MVVVTRSVKRFMQRYYADKIIKDCYVSIKKDMRVELLAGLFLVDLRAAIIRRRRSVAIDRGMDMHE